MKGIAEGTYNSKHAEAAKLYYTTILLCYYTTTLALIVGNWDEEAIQALRRATRAGVFGLWRVRFPPVLVRTGRRLPVQALW